MNRISTIEAYILAGGESSRMGTPKATVHIGGNTMIRRVADVLRQNFDRVSVVADRVTDAPIPECNTIADRHRHCGPLGGLHAALSTASSDVIFLASCDVPFITTDLVRFIVDCLTQHDIIVPAVGTRLHPLCGIYRRSILPVVEHHLTAYDLSLHSLLRNVDTLILPISPSMSFYRPHLLLNVNTPDDLRLAEQVERSGPSLQHV